MFLNVSDTLRGMARPTTDGMKAAGQFVSARMAASRLDAVQLAAAAEIGDPKTVRDLVDGVRWPRIGTLAKVEDALGLEYGTIAAIAAGAQPPSQGDPVEIAINGSTLTRAQKAKLLGMYYEMLDEDERRRGA